MFPDAARIWNPSHTTPQVAAHIALGNLGHNIAPVYADMIFSARRFIRDMTSSLRPRAMHPLTRPAIVAHQIEHMATAFLTMPLAMGALGALHPDRKIPPAKEIVALVRRYFDLLELDRSNVGKYYGPDLLAPSHWGLNDRESAEAVHHEMLTILRRAREGVRRHPDAAALNGTYPSYFLNLFHWMGWIDKEIGEAWAYLTELIFIGAYAAIERQAIPPVIDAARGRWRLKTLDVAGGTGSFAVQLASASRMHDFYGDITLLDLSPVQAAMARRQLSGLPMTKVVEGNAEQMPFPDRSFHVATLLMLLHELPSGARQRVLRETRRLLVPGGTLVVIDAEQDDAPFPSMLSNFGDDLNEPYFPSYRRDPLTRQLNAAGFEIAEPETALFLAKRVVARRPQKG